MPGPPRGHWWMGQRSLSQKNPTLARNQPLDGFVHVDGPEIRLATTQNLLFLGSRFLNWCRMFHLWLVLHSVFVVCFLVIWCDLVCLNVWVFFFILNQTNNLGYFMILVGIIGIFMLHTEPSRWSNIVLMEFCWKGVPFGFSNKDSTIALGQIQPTLSNMVNL